VRANVSESTLRVAFARKLPFKCEIIICPAKEILLLSGRRGDMDSRWRASKDPFLRQPSGPNIVRCGCLARSQTTKFSRSETVAATQGCQRRRRRTKVT
jgi:hypothetical protein